MELQKMTWSLTWQLRPMTWQMCSTSLIRTWWMKRPCPSDGPMGCSSPTAQQVHFSTICL